MTLPAAPTHYDPALERIEIELLLDAVHRAKAVFVDLARLTFIDSSGVHSLVTAHHAAKHTGGRIYVVNAAGPVASVLELTGLDTLLRAPAEERRHV